MKEKEININQEILIWQICHNDTRIHLGLILWVHGILPPGRWGGGTILSGLGGLKFPPAPWGGGGGA